MLLSQDASVCPQPQGLMAAQGQQPAMGAGGNNLDTLTRDVVHRRLILESMLMSEENRLRQLREALQGQYASQPQSNQLSGTSSGGGASGNMSSQVNINPQGNSASAPVATGLELRQQEGELLRQALAAPSSGGQSSTNHGV